MDALTELLTGNNSNETPITGIIIKSFDNGMHLVRAGNKVFTAKATTDEPLELNKAVHILQDENGNNFIYGHKK